MPIPAKVLDALRQNEVSLTKLDLSGYQLTDAYIIHDLVQALAQNSTLTSLDLGSNDIGAAGARALAQNRTLTSLNLWGNHIGDDGSRALAQNSTLTSLDYRLLATHHLTSSASSLRLFSPPTAEQSSSLATAASSTTVTANETATGSIFSQALKLYKQLN